MFACYRFIAGIENGAERNKETSIGQGFAHGTPTTLMGTLGVKVGSIVTAHCLLTEFRLSLMVHASNLNSRAGLKAPSDRPKQITVSSSPSDRMQQ